MTDGLTEEQAAAIPEVALYDYFCAYARYVPDAPRSKYSIRIGTRCLRAADTMGLRTAFERYVRKLKRRINDHR